MRSRALIFLFFVMSLALVAACKRAPAKPDPASSAPALVAVPAPDGLLAEFVMPHPDRAWEDFRAGIGANSLVPTSPAVFLADWLGVPVSALDQIDLIVPLVGALVEETDSMAIVAGIHVKDGARFIELVTAPGGKFTKGESQGGVTEIAPAASKTNKMSYAVSGNYLVVASSADALKKFAPFVSRTLPGRPTPSEEIVATASHAALAGPIVGRLRKVWDAWKHDREADDLAMRTKHGGSSPDFGDPAEALADIDAKATKLFAVLGDLDEARLALSVDPKTDLHGPSYRAVVSMKPSSEAGPAGLEIATMPVAGAEPLLSLPSSVAVALLTRDTAELRDQSSAQQVDAIAKVLGGRLEADDKAKIESAFHSWSKGRGDWLTAGLLWSGSTRAAVLRGAVSDPSELGRGATAMLKLLSVRAIADPLSSWIGDMKLSGLGQSSASADGTIQTVHVVRRPPKVQTQKARDKAAQTDAFDIVWSVGKEVFAGAAGLDAKGAYSSLQKSDGGKTLAEQPFLSRTLERLGPTLSFALFVDVARLSEMPRPDGDGAAVVVTYGKDRKNQAWFELDVPPGLLVSYASLLAGR